MNTMNRKIAMCNQLNMNFDEANELFGEESLESMQMARVNGGVVLTTVAAVIGIIAGLTTIAAGATALYNWYIDTDGPTAGTSIDDAALARAKELGYTITVTKTDSIIQPDGTKSYGVSMTVFAPTLAQ